MLCCGIKSLIFNFLPPKKHEREHTIEANSRARSALEHAITVELADVSIELKAFVAERHADEALLRVLRDLPDRLVGEAASAVPAEEEAHGEHPEAHRIRSNSLLLSRRVFPSRRFISSDRPGGGCHFLHCCRGIQLRHLGWKFPILKIP